MNLYPLYTTCAILIHVSRFGNNEIQACKSPKLFNILRQKDEFPKRHDMYEPFILPLPRRLATQDLRMKCHHVWQSAGHLDVRVFQESCSWGYSLDRS